MNPLHRPHPFAAQRLRIALAALGLSLSTMLAHANALPPPEGYKPPPEPVLVFDVTTQVDGVPVFRRELRMPVRRYPIDASWPHTLRTTALRGCLNLMLHILDDGSMRPTGQLLDDQCQRPVGEWQELKVNGSETQLSAQTESGPVTVRMSVRWATAHAPQLSALQQAELDGTVPLSEAQRQLQALQRKSMARHVDSEAQNRAWRAARQVR